VAEVIDAALARPTLFAAALPVETALDDSGTAGQGAWVVSL